MKPPLTLLDSIRRGRDRGSAVSGSESALSHQFMGQVEAIFKNLPNPLVWRSFLNNDLVLLTDIPEIVQNASIKPDAGGQVPWHGQKNPDRGKA
ncbi:MAG: hypothetical protein K9K63_02800 [Desulfotignum sp.]|nr:hypothetical protein [Desulfotignum sp.]MCF8136217.1 hypothetical protein [Desulfotignum sp.]